MLTVNDLMTTTPYTISPQTLLSIAIHVLQEEEIRQLPVVESDTLVGILTERDVRTMHDSGQFRDATVEGAMTPNPITVTPETPAFRAAEMLRTYKFGALPVVDGARLVGIITISDFLSRMAAETTPEELWPNRNKTLLSY